MVNDRQKQDVNRTRDELKKKQAELNVMLTTPSAEEIALAQEEVKTAKVTLQYSLRQFERMDPIVSKRDCVFCGV